MTTEPQTTQIITTVQENVQVITAGIQGPSGTLTNVTPTGATTSRSIADLFGDQLFAGDYGAIGDGVTDDTLAIQTALNDMYSLYPNGAKLFFTRGTYVASQIIIHRQQLLVSSDGPQAATLMQKAGSNCDFITSENFSSLTGTGANYGTNPLVPSWFGIQDMHINGNASAQSAGAWRGIAWYGNAQMMLGTNLIENCKQDNIYTEAANTFAYSATDWRSEEEGFFDTVISRNAGRYGWLNRGPHDAIIINYIAPENASTGYRSEASGSLYNGAAHIHKIHTYAEGDGTGQYHGAGGTIIFCYTDNDNITLATGITIQFLYQIEAGPWGLNALEILPGANFVTIGVHSLNFQPTATNIIGCNIQAGGGNVVIDNINGVSVPGTSGITFYKIRSNFCTLNGIFSNAQGAGSIAIDLDAAYCRITGVSYINTTTVKYTGGNNNYVQLEDYSAGGAFTTLSGSPGSTDTFLITNDLGVVVSTYPLLSTVNKWAAAQAQTPVALSIVSTAIATNAALGNNFFATLAISAATTMSAPTNPVDGQVIKYELAQPASGSGGTVTWNAVFDFGTTGAPTLTLTNSKSDFVGFQYSSRLIKWVYLGSQLGF